MISKPITLFRIKLSPLNQRRLENFKKNRRGYWSLRLFLLLFGLSLFSEIIANDKPIFIFFDEQAYFPIIQDLPETAFGGEFKTETDYQDPFVQNLISEKGWMIWPPIPYHYKTADFTLSSPAPTPPDFEHWLGTDDQARDVVARLIYGMRISIIFGILLTTISALIGISAGAIQGYFGGLLDLFAQRFIEIWSSLPTLYILIIISSFLVPSFWTVLGILMLFSWVGFVGVVRAEFLKVRNFDYVRSAKALGVSTLMIMYRHILPNAMVATLTLLPFMLTASITQLTSLDFLGFGLPPGSASLGELLVQGKGNLEAPWLGATAFISLATMLSLLVFIGEAVRDAFDPRKLFNGGRS